MFDIMTSCMGCRVVHHSISVAEVTCINQSFNNVRICGAHKGTINGGQLIDVIEHARSRQFKQWKNTAH